MGLDVLIKNALIADGTGGTPFVGNIAVSEGKIVPADGSSADAAFVMDAAGKVASPGFIDMHSHGDHMLPVCPDAQSALGQGITTLFTGHCGMSPMPAHRYYSYFCFEDRAFARVLPAPLGGPNPGCSQILPSDLLRPFYKAEYGADFDWDSVSAYFSHLKKTGIGPNIAGMVGHGQIRLQVLGPDNSRPSTAEEIEQIIALCDEAMDSGAFGISFGLDYEPGWFASDGELEAVARCVARRGKILSTHYQLRGTRRGVTGPHAPVEGAVEMMELALKTGVRLHLSHLSGSYAITPPDADIERAGARRMLALIAEYRLKGAHITWDTICYYPGGDFLMPNLAQRFLPYVKIAGGMRAFSGCLRVGNYKRQIADEVKAGKHPSGSVMTYLNPITQPDWGKNLPIIACADKRYLGKTIGELVKETGRHYVDLLLDILEADPYACYYMWRDRAVEQSNIVYMEQAEVSVSLDVTPRDYDFYAGNPGADLPVNHGGTGVYCGFVKFLQMKKDQPLETTVRQLSANGAQTLGLKDRGKLLPGMAADITVFDYNALSANENFLDPRSAPSGIDLVLVNGKIAVDRGRHTGVRGGQILRA
jgi:N-acyl-D-amino-acid deacylase